ncbi:MAG: DUF2478 domain-containing protein [Pelagimonas sp.]
MKIAYIKSETRGEMDNVLYDVAQKLRADGHRLAGVVQINTERPNGGRCDMDIKVLPDGATLRISQDLGKGACGCRLDPSALETAVSQTEAALAHGADCVIINKFGKQEAEGRGFRSVIAEALARDIPVVVGVNALNFQAFVAFTEGLAEPVNDTPQAIERWFHKETVACSVEV